MFLRIRVLLKEWWWSRPFLHDEKFREIERALRKKWRGKNPYAVARMGGEVYGETPLPVYDEMAKRVGLKKGESFWDLGCGRGRGCYFLSHFYGCESVGIEKLGGFVERAIEVPGVEILQGDYFLCDLNADVIYLYGTCLSGDEADLLAQKIKNAKVVSVSEPLPAGKVIDSFEGKFPWGKTDLYIQIF